MANLDILILALSMMEPNRRAETPPATAVITCGSAPPQTVEILSNGFYTQADPIFLETDWGGAPPWKKVVTVSLASASVGGEIILMGARLLAGGVGPGTFYPPGPTSFLSVGMTTILSMGAAGGTTGATGGHSGAAGGTTGASGIHVQELVFHTAIQEPGPIYFHNHEIPVAAKSHETTTVAISAGRMDGGHSGTTGIGGGRPGTTGTR
jgi:hypothetical protein